jgi:hypothetical protein
MHATDPQIFYFTSSLCTGGFDPSPDLDELGGTNLIATPTTSPTTLASLTKLKVCTGALDLGCGINVNLESSTWHHAHRYPSRSSIK